MTRGLNVERFGFVTLQRVRGAWMATLRGVPGGRLAQCPHGDEGLACRSFASGGASDTRDP